MALIYTELERKTLRYGGYRIIGRFDDADPSGNYSKTTRFIVPSPVPTETAVTAKVADVSANLEFDLNPLNSFNLGNGNEKAIIGTIVTTTRADPSVNVVGLVDAIDTTHPNMLWKPDKFLHKTRTYLDDETGISHTFDEYKQYLIDHKFRGVD